MPSTHLSLHYHLVFSTKERRPLILPQWRDRCMNSRLLLQPALPKPAKENAFPDCSAHAPSGFSYGSGGIVDDAPVDLDLLLLFCTRNPPEPPKGTRI